MTKVTLTAYIGERKIDCLTFSGETTDKLEDEGLTNIVNCIWSDGAIDDIRKRLSEMYKKRSGGDPNFNEGPFQRTMMEFLAGAHYVARRSPDFNGKYEVRISIKE
ncbi:MAG: hypothetical protein Q8N88_03780 [Nanoarchaeota archaeon]|nr:hypothetical protein [Nanoarchaeota archaeon]